MVIIIVIWTAITYLQMERLKSLMIKTKNEMENSPFHKQAVYILQVLKDYIKSSNFNLKDINMLSVTEQLFYQSSMHAHQKKIIFSLN